MELVQCEGAPPVVVPVNTGKREVSSTIGRQMAVSTFYRERATRKTNMVTVSDGLPGQFCFMAWRAGLAVPTHCPHINVPNQMRPSKNVFNVNILLLEKRYYLIEM